MAYLRYSITSLRILFIALVVSALFASGAFAQTWMQLTPLGGPPPQRKFQSTVYDPVTNRLIIFGGCAAMYCDHGEPTLNDVWVLANADGSTGLASWTQLNPTGGPPSPRQSHVAVYDSATNTMVIWSGDSLLFSGTDLSDVWILTNANGLSRSTGQPTASQWIQLFPTGTPPTHESGAGREQSAAVYDPVSNRMIIFGGASCDPCTFFNDVWALTNANGSGGTPQWIQLLPTGGPPNPRIEHSLVYDGSTDRMVLFGGGANDALNDTWVLENASGINRSNGSPVTPQWIQPATVGGPPPARVFHAAAYDSTKNQMLIFGGNSTYAPPFQAPFNDVWLLTNANGTAAQSPTWSQLSTGGTPPSARAVFHHWGLYNPSSASMMIYGGASDASGTDVTYQDSWVLTNGNASSTIGVAGGSNNPQPTVSEPISTGNGNYYYRRVDFTVPGRGMPLMFQRSYNSLDNYAGPLGANWTHSYNIFLTPSSASAVVKWGDGHTETFSLSGGNYVPPPGVFSTLVQNPNGTFLLTRKDQTKFLFSSTGVLTSIQEKNGNTIGLTYGSAGNPTQITDTVGRNLTLTYDASNRITQITDAISRTVSFQYDASNNLIQATDTAGGITTFAYDGSHRVTSITQPNGTTLLQNTYDSSGRVISQTGGRGFGTTLAFGAPGPGATTITDARGNQTVHTYDSSLRIVGVTDAASGNTSFTYDANNDRTSVSNQNAKTTSFTYDGRGNITGITDPLSDSTSFTYDALNDLLTATNAKGNTTSFAYDGKGNLTTIKDALGNATSFTYDGFGELLSKTDARGNTTAYAYDSLGNLNRITDALSHSTNLAYDGVGRLTSITDPNGHAATATYDGLSRLTKIADPLGHQTQFVYDAVGNLLKITDANGHSTSYAYDATNNLVSVTDALGHVTGYSYDPNNNRVVFTNAKGKATNYAYDALNRLTKITDPLSFATSYSYDAVGNVLAVIDAKGQTNKFTFDALNRLLTIVSADSKNVSYAYDPDGNRVSMADTHGTTAYSYDVLDRLTSVTNPGAAVVNYSYDPIGNRASLRYPDGKTVAYGYDAANRLAGATDWLGRHTAYAYDAASNLTNSAYPNGASIAFSYDAANRLLKVVNFLKSVPPLVLAYTLDSVGNRLALNVNGAVTNFSYDPLNELVSAQIASMKSTWSYDAVGNRLKFTAPGTIVNNSYDAGDRLLAAGPARLTYDANGNELSVSKNLSGQAVSYQYDAANRLIAATVGKTNSAFGYDGDGNRVSQSVGAGTYNYVNDVASALPVVLQESGPDGNISYAYGLGLISESGTKFDYFYHYDGLGSVIALSNASGIPSAAYIYDPWGNSLLAVSNNVGTKNKFRFTSEALDPGTGLYYLRARYYDSSTGRFLSQDSFPGFSRLPITKNKYIYADNRPVVFSDPTGNLEYWDDLAVFGVAAIVSVANDYLTQRNVTLTQYVGDAVAAGAEADIAYNCGAVALAGGPVASLEAGAACGAISTAAIEPIKESLLGEPVNPVQVGTEASVSFASGLIPGSEKLFSGVGDVISSVATDITGFLIGQAGSSANANNQK